METMNKEGILKRLHTLAEPTRLEYLQRFGINTTNALGISIPQLRDLAKNIKKNHSLALELWDSGIHDARLLATMIDIPSQVDESQMEQWTLDFDSWDLCDQCCSNLFDKTNHAYEKALEWSKRTEEFVKRAGFVLMAALAVHDKEMDDTGFEQFFPAIVAQCTDERNFVKKAVNWALRGIGKRNKRLNEKAILLAQQLLEKEDATAKWIARDALRELTSERVQHRLHKQENK
jgi:3-methyladenine DNA glycosylase AlkD